MKMCMDMSKDSSNNIIFVTISMTGGGTERVIATLANYWSSQGMNVHIIMIGGDDIAYELDEQIDIRSISGATGGDIKARIGRISCLRNEFKKDSNAVVIAMGTVAAMFSSVAAVGLKNRLILSERNDPNRLNHRPIKGYEKTIRNMLYNKADSIVFQTDMAKKCFPDKIQSKGCIIMNPIRGDISAKEDYLERRKAVMTAGRLTEQKNHRLLIDAFMKAHASHPDYILEIYGEGDCRDKLLDYIDEKDAKGFISLKGFSKDLVSVMNDTRIYVSSSDWEGISNSLAEAMASGMAVIATDCPMGGSAMLINNNDNGFLTKVGNCDELADTLDAIMSDDEVGKKISKKAALLNDELSVESIAKRWEALFV